MDEHPALAAAARFGLGSPAGDVTIGSGDAVAVIAAAARDGIAGFLSSAIVAGAVAADSRRPTPRAARGARR